MKLVYLFSNIFSYLCSSFYFQCSCLLPSMLSVLPLPDNGPDVKLYALFNVYVLSQGCYT